MMINIFSVYKPLLRGIMWLAGVRPQKVEIEPGTVLNFWVPTKPEPSSKPAVVFLHGFALDGILTWQFQVISLARKYAVYVPDFLFFGESFTNRAERSADFQAECVAKGLRKLGVEKCTLVGLSYGGMVGFKMAGQYPRLVESMVVTCSVMGLTESISKVALERIGFETWCGYLLPETVQGVKVLLELGTYRLPWIPNWVYRQCLEFSYMITIAMARKVMFDNRKEKRELLEALVISDKDFKVTRYSQRIHLLWGKEDLIFNTEVVNNLKRQLGDTTMLLSIEKTGHLPQLERPCTYNMHLNHFLACLTED